MLRRCNGGISPLFNVMSWKDNDLQINFEAREVKKQRKVVNLTNSEFNLLTLLVRHPNRSFTREELIERAFGLDFDGYDRTIDSHIRNLRSKIETRSGNPEYIITVRGVGYKFGGEK